MGITHTYYIYKCTQSSRLKKINIRTQLLTLNYKAICVTVTSIHGT